MLDLDLLRSIATQMVSGTTVELQGQSMRVRRTSSQRLKTVAFDMNGRQYEAIEQNPHQSNKFVAVSVDGEVKKYGRSRKKSVR